MEFIYFRRIESEHGARLLPTDANDEIALLKARTLLYILAENQKLAHHDNELYTLYFPTYNQSIKSMAAPLKPIRHEEDDIVAVIPTTPFKQTWEQMGVAYVFGGVENQTLFMQYLSLSKKWLDSHPGSQTNVETKILEVAS